MKSNYLFLLIVLSVFSMNLFSDDMMAMNGNDQKMDMGYVHPFFTHMGMPDPVGNFALRLSGISFRKDGKTYVDAGFHLETGIAKNLGLHIRNDRISNNAHTEITIQYAILQSRDGMKGLSPFIELEIPTHQGEKHVYGLVGFSTMLSGKVIEFNQSLEYSPKEAGLEGSASITGNIGQRFFPIVEFVSEAGNDTYPMNSVIGGIKYRINKAFAVGLGEQIPVTELRDYSFQILLQTDIEF